MKAELKLHDGIYLLLLPAIGTAPLLFLEWMSEFPSGKVPIQKIIDGDRVLMIILEQTKDELEKCVKYINENL